MIKFLNSLFSTGELCISAKAPAAVDESEVVRTLIHYEQAWRIQLPGEPPGFVADAAFRAARVLMTVCRAIVFREINIEDTSNEIRKAALQSSDAADHHYSVDLVLQFLPQVSERANRISESDPILDLLHAIGQEWPLSSTGMKNCGVSQVSPALHHSTLWKMYIDRIISRKDVSRINTAAVRDAVAAALGPFPYLAPELSRLLQPQSESLDV